MSQRSVLGPLVLANALPIAGVALFLVLRSQGKVSLKEIPADAMGPLVGVGVAVALIVALGWIVAPGLAAALRRVGAAYRARREDWRKGSFGALPGLVLLGLLRGVLWVQTGVLALGLLGLVILLVFLVARFALAAR